MPRDALLSKKFFSSLDSNFELSTAFQQEEDEILHLIKSTLYPNPNEKAVYYLEKHNDKKSLDNFIKSADYTILQTQLQLIIKKFKRWGAQYEIEEVNSLDDFLIKLENPTEKTTLLYGDGKRSLETMLVLLEDEHIDLDLRKTIYIQLLANHELSQCIDGCYTRIVSSAQQLTSYRDGPNQVDRWVHAYTTDVARKIAAQRPFAMPESFQVLICRTLDIAVAANELHASNYLLAQAKEDGFPIKLIYDMGALEIAHKMKISNKNKLVELYLDDLAAAVTAYDLVSSISIRLHNDFKQIIADPKKDYLEKINAIETKLGLLGLDPDFLLAEILHPDPLTLKTVEHLQITTTRRLSEKKWFNPIKRGELNILSNIYHFYNFPNNIELNWFVKEGEPTRYRFIDLIQTVDIELSTERKLQLLFSLLRSPGFITNAKNLNNLLIKHSLSFPLATIIPTETIVEILKANSDALVFVNLLKNLGQTKGSEVVSKLNKSFISNIIFEGTSKTSVDLNFFWLDADYFLARYNSVSQEEGLQVTQQLLQQVIAKGYRDFTRLNFYKLTYINYLKSIDFSHCQLNGVIFFQNVDHCKFDHAFLNGAIFNSRVTFSSFREVDLRDTKFSTLPRYFPYSEIDLKNARLSTRSFIYLLEAGISDFEFTDLTAVDFQAALLGKSLDLDFSGANLENNNLQEIDFTRIKLYGSNLKNTNLIGSSFNKDYLDENVSVQGATLSRMAVHTDFFSAGVIQFDHCKIIATNIFDYMDYKTSFEAVSFRHTQFSGHIFDIEFISCDLTSAEFTSLPLPLRETTVMSGISFYNSQLIKTQFRQVKFMERFKLQDCFLSGVTLDDIEMPASVLFKFYENGQRNFNGVNALKGKIPEKLPPIPLLEASLSKEAFIHLYKQGLRDFRLSHLNSFLLSEILLQEAISEIDLKLTGAHYQQSPLGCGVSHSPTHTKRNTHLNQRQLNCNFYFLFQKNPVKETRRISWQSLLSASDTPIEKSNFFKEVTLDQKSLYLLNNPDNIYFYWAYEPDNEALAKAIGFVKESTHSIQRANIKLYFDFANRLATDQDQNIKTFAQNLHQLGFRKGQLTYLTRQNQLVALDLTIKPVQVTHNTLHAKLSSMLETKRAVPASVTSLPNDWRTKLQRVLTHMGKAGKANIRSGLRGGAHYEIGLALMQFIVHCILQATALEATSVDVETKVALKAFARKIVDQEAANRHANDHQHDLTLNVVFQCIERGECTHREQVKADIIDTLERLRPDTQIGMEVFGRKISTLFNTIGEYLSQKFNDIKHSFKVAVSIYEITKPPPSTNLNNRLIPLKTKRKIANWYDQPLLTHFIKAIELAFDELGCNIDLDPNFSESILSGYLYDLWFALEKQGVSSQSSPNLTLRLLQNEPFIQSIFDSTYLNKNHTFYPDLNSTEINLEEELAAQNNLTTEIPDKLDSKIELARIKRSLVEKKNRAQRILNIADAYLAGHDQQINKKIHTEKAPKKINKTSAVLDDRKLASAQRSGVGQPIAKNSSPIHHPLPIKKLKQQPKASLTKPAMYRQQTRSHVNTPKNNRRLTVSHPTKASLSSPLRVTPLFIEKNKKLYKTQHTVRLDSTHQSKQTYSEKRPLSQVSKQIDGPATLMFFTLCARKLTQTKPKPVPPPRIVARYKKATRWLERMETKGIRPLA